MVLCCVVKRLAAPARGHNQGMSTTQTYANHRVLPLGYIAGGGAIAANAGYLLYLAGGQPTCGTVLAALSALALVVVWFKARRNAQIMQDRIIRLEMRLRLAALLPGRQAELPRLTLPQLVALRFASDAELPALVERTLAGEFAGPDAIKRAVKDWQPDHLRV